MGFRKVVYSVGVSVSVRKVENRIDIIMVSVN